MPQSFRDLKVWKRSIMLAKAIYALTETFPSEERFGLISQLRRAAVSIASNIAEGTGRRTNRDFQQFVGMARGSNYELQTQLVLSFELKFGDPRKIKEAEQMSHEIGKMLSALSDYLAEPVEVSVRGMQPRMDTPSRTDN
jgi:four helix bundle protein